MDILLEKEPLKECIKLMASAMNFQPLPDVKSELLIEHVLFDGKYGGIEGKNAFNSIKNKLITEREYRNLFIAHCATKISSHNGLDEPSENTYNSKSLCHKFEIVLLGNVVTPWANDIFDSWEEKNA